MPMTAPRPCPLQTLETRSAGFALAVFVHFFMSFLLGKRQVCVLGRALQLLWCGDLGRPGVVMLTGWARNAGGVDHWHSPSSAAVRPLCIPAGQTFLGMLW